MPMEDIMYQVFEQLHASVDVDSPGFRNAMDCRQALARSARSCKAFTRPASAVLWRSLPSDVPLLKLLCALGIAENPSEIASTAPNSNADVGDKTVSNPVSESFLHIEICKMKPIANSRF